MTTLFEILGDPPFEIHNAFTAVAELYNAGIPTRDVKFVDSGAHQTKNLIVEAKLGRLKFTRAWRYWVVHGPVPLDVATEMHKIPVCAETVRVNGNCGCPPPNQSQATRLDLSVDELQILDRAKLMYEVGNSQVLIKALRDADGKSCHIVDDAESVGKLYITTYHIDSVEGLKQFVDITKTIKY